MTSNLESLALFAAVVAIFVYRARAQRRRQRETLDEAARILRAPSLEDRGEVRGQLAGRDVRVRLTSRGTGSSSVSWTEVVAASSSEVTQLGLRPQTLAEEALKRVASTIDVSIGDAAFDAAFIVEGAPEAAVRSVLSDEALRARLLACKPVELTQTHAEICLAKRGWVAPTVLLLMLQSAVELAERLEKAGLPDAVPYRGAVAGDLSSELAALAASRARRVVWERVAFFGFLAIAMGLVLGSHVLHCR
jgi:hypothetical protein